MIKGSTAVRYFKNHFKGKPIYISFCYNDAGILFASKEYMTVNCKCDLDSI